MVHVHAYQDAHGLISDILVNFLNAGEIEITNEEIHCLRLTWQQIVNDLRKRIFACVLNEMAHIVTIR